MSDFLNGLNSDINNTESLIQSNKETLDTYIREKTIATDRLLKAEEIEKTINSIRSYEVSLSTYIEKKKEAVEERLILEGEKQQPRKVHTDGEDIDQQLIEVNDKIDKLDSKIEKTSSKVKNDKDKLADDGYNFEADGVIGEQIAELETLIKDLDSNIDKTEKQIKIYGDKLASLKKEHKSKQAILNKLPQIVFGPFPYESISVGNWLQHSSEGPVYVKSIDKEAMHLLSRNELEKEPHIIGHRFLKGEYVNQE